ncbi:dipeptidase [Sandarakinorhabdus sp.]|jgi:microsomal dipeptidase-like Zn-dependent dipeptidase|uniref:dipeptidase n=1 Tax=Sandarakinorhabdus sp. TaxID=1916663 RepID=UPI0028AC0080|nr:dipeptidase [Sandarakinorhabdus sp.]
MKKLVWGTAALLGVAAVGFFGFAPGIVERGMNRNTGATWPVSAQAQALHKTLTVIDLHADTLMWKRDLLSKTDQGHVDLNRLEAGNVALQVFSSVTKTPRGQNYERNSGETDNITPLVIAQGQPVRTWNSLLERSLWHAEKLHDVEARSAGRLRIITSPADLARLLADRAAGKKVTGALLSTEGGQNLEGQVANVARLQAAGFRMLGLAHFFDTELAGSMAGEQKGGLTPLGAEVVREAEKRGMIIDVAHSSPAAFADVLKIATRPVVVSHGGVKGACDTPRNLSDDQLRALAANGGVVGIGYWDAAICQPTPEATAKAILHAVSVAGIDHVGLGSDYDGATTVGFDTAHLDAVTQALMTAGMSAADIAKVMGGNTARLLAAGLAPR